jgi:hypothetical protein
MTESQTLLSVLFPGKGITDLGKFAEAGRTRIVALFEQMGESAALGNRIAFDNELPMMFAAQDRRVLGCMTDLMKEAKLHLEEAVRDNDEIVREMNDNPLQYGGMDSAEDRAFKLLHKKDIERPQRP